MPFRESLLMNHLELSAEAGASQATLRQPDNGSLLSKSLSRNISRTWSRVLPGPSDPDFRRLGIDNHCTYSFKDVAFGVGVCMDMQPAGLQVAAH